MLQGLGRWNHALALAWVAHDNLCANNIYRNGNEAQRRKYLPGLCSGRKIGALGLTEPGAGSDALGSMRTTARRDGDHYVLNGSKIFITNGPIADVLLVYAKTDKAKGAQGISAFIVEKDFPGFKVAQKLDEDGLSRQPDRRAGVRGMPGAGREPASASENRGVAIVMSGLDLERAMVSPLCLGIAERALELSIDYAQARQQFGKPIGSFQMVQSMLAEMYVAVETMRTFTYRTLAAAARLEIGGGGRGDIHMLTAASVMYAAEFLSRRARQGGADPWRLGLHLGVGDQPALPLDQADGDRRWHHRGAQADHLRRIAEGHEARWLTALPNPPRASDWTMPHLPCSRPSSPPARSPARSCWSPAAQAASAAPRPGCSRGSARMWSSPAAARRKLDALVAAIAAQG